MPPVRKNEKKSTRQKRGNNNRSPKKGFSLRKLLIAIALVFVCVFGYLKLSSDGSFTPTKVYNYSYTELVQEIDTITEIQLVPFGGEGNSNVYKLEGRTETGDKVYSTITGETQLSNIMNLAEENDINVSSTGANDNSTMKTIITWVGVILVVGLVISAISKGLSSLIQGAQGGAGGAQGNKMTKSKAKLIKSDVRLTDVAGIDDERYEVEEIIDMLKNPKRYTEAGVKIPKGVLLEGAPGCGKTLLAKAVAGEAGVPFYSVSGSDFVELYVGVGSARMRDTFEEARKNAPCIIFIDEIDAIAKKRSTAPGGGNDERESTLNALLTEIDGAEGKDGIIVMGATNRADMLDPAVKRPGRFDRIITIPNPDVKGREAILKVHAKDKKLSDKVTFNEIAKRTSGFSGAQLANVMNEAAVMMVRERAKSITMRHIDEAIDRTIMGPARVSHKYTERERKLVAFHEAGHAVVGLNVERADVVQKITIVPRGDAGGYCMSMPEEETFVSTAQDILDRICGLLGGRIVEELVFGSITTGAHNDLEKATHYARSLVMDYGMSSLGVQQLRTTHGSALGGEYSNLNTSDATKERVDEEVNKILGSCYERTRDLLREHMTQVELIANTLLEYDTITKEQIDELVSKGHLEDTKPEFEVVESKELNLAVIERKED